MVSDDRFLIRMFALADWAAIPPDQKIYMGGGGVSQVHLPQLPGPLPPLSLVVQVHVPWTMTSQPYTFSVRLLDGDRNAIGPDPLIGGTAETGRPPGHRPGDELTMQFVVGLAGQPVQATGTIYFHLTVGDEVLGVLPIKVVGRQP